MPLNDKQTLNNEDRNVKQVMLRRGYQGRGRVNEEVKGSENSQCILYTCMTMEH
jgi:hypothetical protein